MNFATIYGQREFSLAQQLGIDTKDAKRFIADYFAKYAGVPASLSTGPSKRLGAKDG